MVRVTKIFNIIMENLRACRLPFISSDDESAVTEGKRSRESEFKEIPGGLNSLIVLTLAILLVAVPFVTFGAQNTHPIVSVSSEDPFTETSAINFSIRSMNSSSHTVLLNDSLMTDVSGWRVSSAAGIEDSLTLIPRDLVSSGVFTVPQGFRVSFERLISLPLVDYTEVNLSASLSTESGSGYTMLQVDFWSPVNENPQASYLDVKDLEVGTPCDPNISIPMSDVIGSVSTWSIEMRVTIDVTPLTPMTFSVGNVAVVAESDEALAPLRVDLRTLDGESIFSNSFSAFCGRPPMLVLTRSGFGGTAFLVPRSANDTFFLKPCNLTGSIAWPQASVRWDYEPVMESNLTLSISEGSEYTVTARIPTTKLLIQMEPDVPLQLFEVRGPAVSDAPTYYFMGLTEVPDVLYLPPYPGDVAITIETVSEWYLTDQHIYVRVDATSNGTKTVHVTVDYPFIELGRVALDLGTLVLAAFAGVLFLLFWRRLRFETRSSTRISLLRDPRLGPSIFLVLSAMLPWLAWAWSFGGYSDLFIPTVSRVTHSSSGVGILGAIYVCNSVNVLMPIFLFWIPLLLVASRIGTSLSEDSQIWTFKVLMVPAILALLTVTGGVLLGYSVGSGALLALVSPMLWLVEYKIYRRFAGNGERE